MFNHPIRNAKGYRLGVAALAVCTFLPVLQAMPPKPDTASKAEQEERRTLHRNGFLRLTDQPADFRSIELNGVALDFGPAPAVDELAGTYAHIPENAALGEASLKVTWADGTSVTLKVWILPPEPDPVIFKSTRSDTKSTS